MSEPTVSLSRLELLVLARCSSAKPPGLSDLVEVVQKLALPADAKGQVRARVLEVLAQLAGRGLVDDKRRLSDVGKAALARAFGQARAPAWKDVADAHLPALALGLQPGSDEAKRALRDGDSLHVALVRDRVPAASGGNAANAARLADALLAEAVGLPAGSKVTLAALQAAVIARALGEPAKGKAQEIVARVAAARVRARKRDKRTLLAALARQWVSEAAAGNDEVSEDRTPPLSDEPLGRTMHQLVEDAIARTGPAGRYGHDKVFLSALWHTLERSGELPEDYTFEQLGRWLAAANRRGELSLARADLVGAMDPELVARSELTIAGASFHFVLDRNATMGGR